MVLAVFFYTTLDQRCVALSVFQCLPVLYEFICFLNQVSKGVKCACRGGQGTCRKAPLPRTHTHHYPMIVFFLISQKPVMSHHGMLTTVAYQLGPSQQVTYALEGAVSIAGQSVRWLRDNLEFFEDVKDIGEL